MSILLADFRVYGEPKPAGSKRAFVNPKTKQAILTDASGQAGKDWRADVKAAARPCFAEPVMAAALVVDITFYRARNKGHYGTGRNAGCVKDTAPAYPTVAPDVDKLSRAILDALTGIAWRDDAQVVEKTVRKRYGSHPGARIAVWLADEQTAADLTLAERLPFAA